MKKVAIQGIKGSYHHQVALNYFGQEIELLEFLSFDELANSIVNNNCDYGVMAIENSIAGSIIPNYALIDNLNLKITGEYYININHQLMAISGSKIQDLEVVASHPMALLQCKNFFKKYPKITLIEDKDTAEVAFRIQRDNIKKMGAIASVHASQLYNLNILSKDIQTIKNNETRFVIISKNSLINDSKSNKASIKFSLSHKTGSLAAILNILRDCNLNLTKIQSLPIIETPWKYSFFIDTTYDSIVSLEKALKLIDENSESLKVLGIYKNNIND
jgi:prephenate dehydratase